MVNMLSSNMTRKSDFRFLHFFEMNTEISDFEKLEFSPFVLQNIVLDNDNDPDDNFFSVRRFSDMS